MVTNRDVGRPRPNHRGRRRGGPRGSDVNFSRLGTNRVDNDPNSVQTDFDKGDGNHGRRRDFGRGFGNRGGRGDFRRGFGNRGGRGDFRRGFGNRGGRGDFGRGFGNRGGRGDFKRGFGNDRERGDDETVFENSGDLENGSRNRREDSDASHKNYDFACWNEREMLDEDTRNYFSRVLERLQTGESFENPEDEEIFVTNVMEQTDGKEVLISCNKLGSKCLQHLLQLPHTKPESILKFTTKFSKDLIYVCTHHFGGHVVQSTLIASFRILQNHYGDTDSDNDSSSISELISWLTSVGQICLENLNDFLHDLYACHVVSTVIQLFGGQNINESITRSKRSRDYNLKRTFSETGEEITERPPGKPMVNRSTDVIQVPEECSEMLKKISKEFRQQDLHDLAMNQTASPVLKILLIVTQEIRPKLCQKIVKAILKQVAALSEEGKLSSFLTNNTASHVMESVVLVADEKKKEFIWKNFLQGHLKEIALHPKANFVLQRFHNAVDDNEQLEAILNELDPCFEEIFSACHFGVVISLGEACKRLKVGQAHFVKSILSVMHCWDPEDRQLQIVPLLLCMVPYEEFNEEENKLKLTLKEKGVNYHGSLILQHVLWFNKPQKFARSLLSLDPVDLRMIICDPKGSHVVEALMQSAFVGEKLRDKLIHILRPELVYLACNKYGSRTVDTMWEVSSLKQKNTIAEELSKKELLMFADRYGQYVAKKAALSHFKHRRKDWEQAMSSSNKKRKLFEDIVGNVKSLTQ